VKYSKRTKYHEQYPARGSWVSGKAVVNPSYLTIGGSGVVGNFGAESPMSERGESPLAETNETAAQESAEGASMNSGSGAAAGAAATSGGSGVA